MLEYIKKIRRHWLRLRFGSRGLTRYVNGTRLQIHPDYRWYFAATHDKEVAEYFRSRIVPGSNCLSVGANIGIYPLQMASWIGEKGKVFAFEPNPNSANAMRQHIQLNHLESRIEVFETAVSNETGKVTFSVAGTDGMSRIGSANPLIENDFNSIEVPVTTIDDFCEKASAMPTVLMMDIEGFEIAALKGSEHFFRSAADVVAVVEMHPNDWENAGTTAEDLKIFLDRNQLKMVPLTGQRDSYRDYGHVALERLA